jgi:hypothetical protein
MPSLDFKQARFHCGGAAQPPEQTGEPKDQFPLDSRLSVVIGNDGCLEPPVVLRILEGTDHRLSGKAVADRIAAGVLFAFRRNGSSALEGVAPVGLNLLA